jgi:hypothetical protein
MDRLRSNPVTGRLAERLAGQTRVSRVWVKTASEHQGVLVVTAAVMLWLGVLVGRLRASRGGAAAGLPQRPASNGRLKLVRDAPQGAILRGRGPSLPQLVCRDRLAEIVADQRRSARTRLAVDPLDYAHKMLSATAGTALRLVYHAPASKSRRPW